MNKVSKRVLPKGMFEVDVNSGTHMCEKTVCLRPEDIRVIECLKFTNTFDGEKAETMLIVYCVGQDEPYKLVIPEEEFYSLMNQASGDA